MALVLFDTNILIDWSKGYSAALTELSHWDEPAISAITWMEFYGGADEHDVAKFDLFLTEFGFEVIAIDDVVMRAAAELLSKRRRFGPKISLPDAIITATAKLWGLTIITRNTKDFKGVRIRVPYELETISTVRVINIHPPEDTSQSKRRRK